MKFTIELKELDRFHRLQKDNSWRIIDDNRSLIETDFQTNNPGEVLGKSSHEGEIVLDGVKYKVNPTLVDFGNDNVLSTTSLVFRKQFPILPSIDQLRDTIANGDDSKHNSLILNVYGKFELRTRPPYDISKNDPTVIVRNETYSAGNEYVGVKASKDEQHVKQEYKASLEFWIRHLAKGVTQEYCDLASDRKTVDIIAEIKELENNWTAQY